VVIANISYIPKVFSHFISPIRKLDCLASDYFYDNIEVYFIKNLYYPFNFGYWHRGEKSFNKIFSLLNSENFSPDLIHAHFSWPCGNIGIKLKEKLGIPLVLTIHENREWFLKEDKHEKIRNVWRKTDAIIRVNQLDVPLLSQYNNKVFSIPNGFNESLFRKKTRKSSRELLGLNPKDKIIFTLGHLTERKGFMDLLLASKILSQRRKDFKIFIGGDGPQRKYLDSFINKEDLSFVKLLGYIPEHELPLWMNATDLFSITSYSEGNPTVMFEALGCGKPVLATRVGGIPEIIVSENFGLLMDNNAEDIAFSIDKALDKEWDYESIRKYGSNFTWSKIANQILEVYNSLIF
jgi:glycosyltransferase involved in cell wall biosynthesis